DRERGQRSDGHLFDRGTHPVADGRGNLGPRVAAVVRVTNGARTGCWFGRRQAVGETDQSSEPAGGGFVPGAHCRVWSPGRWLGGGVGRERVLGRLRGWIGAWQQQAHLPARDIVLS